MTDQQARQSRLRSLAEAVYGLFSIVSAVLLFTMTVLISLLITLMILGYRPLFIKSGSMEPTIPVGSVILSRAIDSGQARPGQIITFTDPKNPGQTLTHRIKHVAQDSDGRSSFTTQGDANDSSEEWFLGPDAKVGIYLGHITAIGYGVAWMTQSLTRIALLALIVLYVVYAGMRWIWRR